jgi:rare lipoprotein A
MRWKKYRALLLLLVVIALLLASCAGDKTRESAEEQDGPSTINLTAADVKDAVPKSEPLARYGNHSPYEVFGKKYRVMDSRDNYHERGVASWYGSKFHGRRTSSGEPYDMHLATAAHKSLPLPSYAEVTNLDNGKRVIVKINDRGPFKDDRLIDLSYGAALRLDMIATGTARVEVRVIDPGERKPARRVVSSRPVDGTYLQAGAYGQRSNAEELAGRLVQSSLEPVSIHETDSLFRVWLGPFLDNAEVEKIIQRAIDLGFERPHRVKP